MNRRKYRDPVKEGSFSLLRSPRSECISFRGLVARRCFILLIFKICLPAMHVLQIPSGMPCRRGMPCAVLCMDLRAFSCRCPSLWCHSCVCCVAVGGVAMVGG